MQSNKITPNASTIRMLTRSQSDPHKTKVTGTNPSSECNARYGLKKTMNPAKITSSPTSSSIKRDQTSTSTSSRLPAMNNIVKTSIKNTVGSEITESLMKKLVSAVTDAVTSVLSSHLEDMQNKIRSQEVIIDDLEQYTRRNNLRFYGIPEKESENTDDTIRKIVGEKLGVKIDSEDICRSHRLGPKKKNSTTRDDQLRPRPIIVKFVRYNTRRLIFANKRKLKGTKITIREDLTNKKRLALQSAIKKYGNRNVWTMDGRIYFMGPDHKKTVYHQGVNDQTSSNYSEIDD